MDVRKAFSIYINEKEREMLREMAKEDGQSGTEFIRRLIIKEYRKRKSEKLYRTTFSA